MADEAPVFKVAQPDGTHVDIDLSAAGDIGDFAFRATSNDPGRSGYFFAYHTGEASIFVDVLICMAANRPTADVIADIERVRRDLTTRTSGRGYTSTSESTVDATLARLTARTADSAVGDREYQAGPGGSATLTQTHGDLHSAPRL